MTWFITTPEPILAGNLNAKTDLRFARTGSADSTRPTEDHKSRRHWTNYLGPAPVCRLDNSETNISQDGEIMNEIALISQLSPLHS